MNRCRPIDRCLFCLVNCCVLHAGTELCGGFTSDDDAFSGHSRTLTPRSAGNLASPRHMQLRSPRGMSPRRPQPPMPSLDTAPGCQGVQKSHMHFLLKPRHMLHVQVCKQHVEAGRHDGIDNMSEYVMQQRIDTCAGGMHECCQIVDPVNAPMQFIPTEKS